ncbi:hypothetical protein [Entomospira culicis]|uniref:Uncharacterized protein n=1 Tax=Entomospira culicis TaxID=2719989 RepID=A0A968KUS0_9SPIO|nr:hypothetical protein [Entomospira culicis]NIZ19196.1 hypothetical protein [Entomospira culicis]NIZ69410.1 hypothetical protein [Entomospira culicis]WDI36527.1 hypothetical protein PVA46_04170 [Entomospira culicis]WDI38153.1 hypothetical protein PVA47_04170 [Entomospira culicis]
MIKKLLLLLCLLVPASALFSQDISLEYEQIIELLDSIGTPHQVIEEVMVAYLLNDEALVSQEFLVILLYFELHGWLIHHISLAQERQTLFIVMHPQIATIRAMNQSLLANLLR